jgi:hypothetical protein
MFLVLLACCDRGRQIDRDGGSAVDLAVHGDRPTMCIDDSLAGRKPQSRARDRAVGCIACTKEAFEQLIDVRFRDPDTRVGPPVNLIAFASTLLMTWPIRSGSSSAMTASAGTSRLLSTDRQLAAASLQREPQNRQQQEQLVADLIAPRSVSHQHHRRSQHRTGAGRGRDHGETV